MASKKELKALITLAGKVDPSLQAALLKTTGNTKKLSESLKQSSKHASKFGDMFKASFLGNTVANAVSKITSKVIELGTESINLASDLIEVQNVVDTTFAQNASQVDAWAKTTLNAYGITELQAKQWSGSMGAMLKSSNIAADDMLIMSTNLAGLAGDFASFYNLEHDNAWQKIRSGIAGESEPLKELGINMSVANLEAYALGQGIKKSFSNMTQAEQSLLRYNYLMKVSADAQGDFAKTSDTFANQQKLFTNNIKQLGASIATKALPALTSLYQKANDFINNIDVDQVFSIFDKGISAIQPFIPLFEEFGQKLLTVGKEALPHIQKGLKFFMKLIAELMPYITKLGGFIAEIGGKLFNILMPDFTKVGEALMPIILKLGDLLLPIFEKFSALVSALAPIIGMMVENAIAHISNLVNAFMPIVENIMGCLGGLIDFITGVFTGNWELAWSGVIDFFSNLFSGLINIVKAPINYIIEMINHVTGGIGTISVPDWVPLIGGKSFTLPTIPTFARGGIATQASIFGEAGPEMAIPLRRTSRSLALLNQTAQILGIKEPREQDTFKSTSSFNNIGLKGQQAVQKIAQITIQVMGEVNEQAALDIKAKVKEVLEELSYEEEVIAFG